MIIIKYVTPTRRKKPQQCDHVTVFNYIHKKITPLYLILNNFHKKLKRKKL